MIVDDGALSPVRETIAGLFEVLVTTAARAPVAVGARAAGAPCTGLLGVGAIVTARRAVNVTNTDVSAVGAPDEAGMRSLFAVHGVDGPAMDCLSTGTSIQVADLTIVRTRWPEFRAAAADVGIGATRTTPIKGTTMVGALTLFYGAGAAFGSAERVTDAVVGYGTRQVAQAYELVQTTTRSEQLQVALDNRVLIEQAKGALAERHGIGVEAAFTRMRRYARPRRRRLHEVANAVLTGSLDLPGNANTG